FLWIVLSFAIGHGLTFAQISAPRLDVRVDSSNVVFGLSGQSGLLALFGRTSTFTDRQPHPRVGIPKAVSEEIRLGPRRSRIGVGRRHQALTAARTRSLSPMAWWSSVHLRIPP